MIQWALVACGLFVATWIAMIALAARLPDGLLKETVSFLPHVVTMLRRLRTDPRVPWSARLAAVVAIAWVVSPVDLLPEFLPVIGPLDDVVAVVLLLRFAARRTPGEALLEAWPGDPAVLDRWLGTAGTDTR